MSERDIVEQLQERGRGYPPQVVRHPQFDLPVLVQVMPDPLSDEAADEISRLRAEVERGQRAVSELDEALEEADAAAAAESTRLRAESAERLRLYEKCEDIRASLHAERFEARAERDAALAQIATLEAALRQVMEVVVINGHMNGTRWNDALAAASNALSGPTEP